MALYVVVSMTVHQELDIFNESLKEVRVDSFVEFVLKWVSEDRYKRGVH
jgi:hypothetical protein